MAANAQSNLNGDHRNALLASLTLGVYSLLIVPIYFAFNPIDAAGIRALMVSLLATSSCLRASLRRALCLV